MATAAPGFAVLENKDELIAELRSNFKSQFIDAKSPKLEKFYETDINRIYNDDLYALSFLNWKKGVVKDAVNMVAQVLEWRKENNVADLSVADVGENIMKRGVCYIHGRGLDGKRVLCLIARLQSKDEKDQMRRLFMFWLERLQRNEPGQHVTFILDTYKTAMSNVDLGMIRFIIDSFSVYFPDLLERIVILDMPWIMNAIWKIVKQWMSEEQRSRVVFCSRKDLPKLIAKDQLTKAMDGTSDWTYSFPPFPDDLNQKHSFEDDPMNFKKTGPLVSKLPNGDVSLEEDIGTSVDINVELELPGSSSVTDDDMERERSRSSTPARHDEKAPRNQSPRSKSLSSKPPKSPESPSKSRRDSRRSSLKENDTKDSQKQSSPKENKEKDSRKESSAKESDGIRRRKTTTAVIEQTLPPNKGNTRSGGKRDSSPSGSPGRQSIGIHDEVALGKLLFMSPVSEMIFEPANERLESYIKLRNPNRTHTDSAKEINVAFKIKTTSPERYHVKPSVGILVPGESLSIRIYISPGYEATMSKDRFLVLYKEMKIEDERPSHADVVAFWRRNSDRMQHFEHRVRVRLEGSVLPPEDKTVNEDAPALFKSSSSALSLPDQENRNATMSQLHQQVTLLNNKIIRLESDSRWIRRRMRHTMGLLFVVVALLLLMLYHIIVMSYKRNVHNVEA